MNIFYIDSDPEKAAKQLPDKLVVKMTLETAQILSTALFIEFGYKGKYKPTHKSHPSVLWAAESQKNWMWLYRHGMALGKEYCERYGKASHASIAVMEECKDFLDAYSTGNWGFDWNLAEFTAPPMCMPRHYKIPGNEILAYRNYLRYEKASYATWKRNKPAWWI